MPTPSSLRVIFAGTPVFATRHLQALLDSAHQVVAVYTQPDRPAGRGKKITASPVKELAQQHQLPVLQPTSLKGEDEQEKLAAFNADLMVVVAYGLILPQRVLDTPRLGCINVHASLLPRWRGAAPIQRAIEAGDRETGITIMQMDAGLDTGPMLLKASCEITAEDTSAGLHDRLAEIGCHALIETLTKLQGPAKVTAEWQNDSEATYAEKILKSEAQIDWTLPAVVLQRRIRAFVPFPVMFTCLQEPSVKETPPAKLTRVKIFQSTVVESTDPTAEPGTIIAIDNRETGGVVVACGEQSLLIQRMQLPGKSVLSTHQVLLGHSQLFAPGNRLVSETV